MVQSRMTLSVCRSWSVLGSTLALLCWLSPLSAQEAAHPPAKPMNDAHAPAAAAHAHAAGHDDAHPAPTDSPIEWKTDLALWSLITFGVTLVVLRGAAWGPLTASLDARESKIRQDIDQAESNRVKAEQMLADYQKKLSVAQEEVAKVLAEARRDAEHTRQDILGQAEKDVSAMKDRAINEINTVKSQALDELFGHLSGTVAQATERVLGRALTPADQDRLINEALAEFSKRTH